MTRPIQEPELRFEDGACGGEISSHPAFGQISASRIKGTVNLYGSDFAHHNFIAVRINASELRRDLSHDSHYAGKEYIEVYMSEAQWATFVSSLGVGSGPCCTITSLHGKSIPGLPPAKSRVKQFTREVDERLDRVANSIRTAMEKVDELKIPKVKANELKGELDRALMNLTSNIDFVAESFEEHAEKIVEQAKTEIHGYMTGVFMRAGLTAIQSDSLPLAIEQSKVDG